MILAPFARGSGARPGPATARAAPHLTWTRDLAQSHPPPDQLSDEERKSLTHGGFRLDSPHREVYRRALRAVEAEGPPVVVSGLYALYQHTGIYRRTKDLDLMVRPQDVVELARVLKAQEFRVVLKASHWIAKAVRGDAWIDLVFGMANGLHFVDDDWIGCAHPGRLAGVDVRVAAPEDLIFHRLFIWERHRSDMADIAHLILTHGPRLDWDRLLRRVGDHWRLLMAQLHFFDFVYPGRPDRIPRAVREDLLERSRRSLDAVGPPSAPDGSDAQARRERERICQGTLISRFSFAIDVNEWGYRDYRAEAVEAACTLPVVEEIRDSDVWDDLRPGEGEPGGAAGCEGEQTSPAPWGIPAVDDGEGA